MATVSDYLTQLQSDKQTLVDNLVAKGVDATSDETFTSLVPKVASIEGGGKYAPSYISFHSYTGTDLTYELENLDTSNVTYMRDMFKNCYSLTSLDLSKWNTSNVTTMAYMFDGCSKLTNVDLSGSTGITGTLAGMFRNCTSLAYVDMRSFDFTNVSNSSSMFQSVPATCEIIVKDETAKTWITEKFTTLTNVKTVAEKEAEGE